MRANDNLYFAMHDGPEYTAPKCTNGSGKASDGPNTVYFVVQDAGQPALDEADPDAITEMLVTNRWSADDGDHYFTWTKDEGWELVFLKEGGGARRYFENPKVAEAAGVTKPTSAPTVTCPFVPYKK